jgi:tetratricopeptide (TPR) repeat protein
MRSYLLLLSAALALAGCAPNQPTVAVSQNANAASTPPRNERSTSVIGHTTENQTPVPANTNTAGPGKWSASGDPIDTAKFDGTIAAAEKVVKAKPGDETAKKNLAQAYYDRGAALTEARQYAAALGDYRRALKYDPSHEESKDWIDQIEKIYKMLKKEAPKEGQEPPPLPFKKS